jgi:tRNA U34 5-carboxymethylaminomethyl modifying GTPase MnmE/TrmE
MSWFAERADLIIVLFDAHKLDISDELRQSLDLLRPHQDKVRVLLNKADLVTPQQLMRVYGALMWQLGKVLHTPEACRVYISSFWERPLSLAYGASHALLSREKEDLLDDLRALPRNAALRREWYLFTVCNKQLGWSLVGLVALIAVCAIDED